MKELVARHAIGKPVRGTALSAHDGFSARYDLDRDAGVFSRPAHQLAGQSYDGKVLVPQIAGMAVYMLMALVLLYKPEGLFKQ